MGNTEYVWMIFFGNASFRFSRRKEPIPEPVPPAMLCISMKPWVRKEAKWATSRLSLFSASRVKISIVSSLKARPCS